MVRTITKILPIHTLINDGDMRLIRALPQDSQQTLGPFVFIDHYRHNSKRGIGDRPHPHAGIEVVSYLLDGSVEHRDSMGFVGRLSAGDAQFIRAGRGMLLAERPLEGRHGLQLWVNLPPAMKHSEPTYASFRSTVVPLVRHADSCLYVIAGRVNDTQGPMELSGGAVFARLSLEPHAQATLTVDATLELGLYVLQGEAGVGAAVLSSGMLGLLSVGTQVHVTNNGGEAVEVALIGGQPVDGDVLFHGPFVMDTPERLIQARRDFVAGRMGTLDGVPF